MKIRIVLEPGQYLEYSKIISEYSQVSRELLKSTHYAHYYNLLYLANDCIKKLYNPNNMNKKKITVAFTIPQYDSFKFLYNYLNLELSEYRQNLLNSLFQKSEKIITDINHTNFYNGHKEQSTNF